MNKKIEVKNNEMLNDNHENSSNDAFNKMFDNYVDDMEKKSPAGGSRFVSEIVYQKFFDVTFGYLISSTAGLFFLMALLPVFYTVHDGIIRSLNNSAPIGEIFSALGIGWFIILFIATGFFTGGVALFNSMRIGKPILKYMFILSAFIIIFEIRYSICHSGIISFESVLFFMSLLLCVAMIFALAAVSYKNHSIKIMLFLNYGLVIFNSIMIVRYFISFNSLAMSDRHVHYLTLLFITAIFMQTVESVRTFFYIDKKSLKV